MVVRDAPAGIASGSHVSPSVLNSPATRTAPPSGRGGPAEIVLAVPRFAGTDGRDRMAGGRADAASEASSRSPAMSRTRTRVPAGYPVASVNPTWSSSVSARPGTAPARGTAAPAAPTVPRIRQAPVAGGRPGGRRRARSHDPEGWIEVPAGAVATHPATQHGDFGRLAGAQRVDDPVAGAGDRPRSPPRPPPFTSVPRTRRLPVEQLPVVERPPSTHSPLGQYDIRSLARAGTG